MILVLIYAWKQLGNHIFVKNIQASNKRTKKRCIQQFHSVKLQSLSLSNARM